MSARSRASNKYAGNNYDRVIVMVKKGQKRLLKEYADRSGISINRLINRILADQVPGFDPVDGVPVNMRPAAGDPENIDIIDQGAE